MPETVPSSVNEDVTPSGLAGLRFGISNNVALQTEAWTDVSGISYRWREGLTLSGIILLNDPTSLYRLALAPKISALVADGILDSGLLSASLVVWLPPFPTFVYSYAGTGPGIDARFNAFSQREYGVIVNVGVALQFSDASQINLRSSGVYSYNVNEQNPSAVWSLNLSVIS